MSIVAEVRGAYAALGVPFGAPAAEVRSAYRRGVRLVHPDAVVADGGIGDPKRLGELRDAYERLRPLGPPSPVWTRALAAAAYAPRPPASTIDVRA